MATCQQLLSQQSAVQTLSANPLPPTLHYPLLLPLGSTPRHPAFLHYGTGTAEPAHRHIRATSLHISPSPIATSSAASHRIASHLTRPTDTDPNAPSAETLPLSP